MGNVITSSGQSTLPAGLTLPENWHLQSYLRTGNVDHTWIYRGPYSTRAAARSAIRAAQKGATINISKVSDGIAEITVQRSTEKESSAGDAPTDFYRESWSLTPVTVATDVSAHPSLDASKAAYVAALDAVQQGRFAEAVALLNGDPLASDFVALWLAGCRQYETVGYQYRYSKEYPKGDAQTVKTAAAAGISTALSVVSWAGVEGSADAPFGEPKYIQNGEMSYEWRSDGVSVSSNGDTVTLSYCYTGLWKWAQRLYTGGTWAPQLPQFGG